MKPEYPIYIISKGRWDSRLTSKSLEFMGIPYKIVVEPQEFDQYAKVIDSKKILVLPFSNMGLGSIPARNWVWDHAIAQNSKKHWILDDNINGFFRLNKNLKVLVKTGAIFKAAEDFVDRYENVPMAGFNYAMFAKRKDSPPPFVLNTRIYSCILLKNDISYRWRGKFNEDTDLSLRILKDGYCTILFNAFLAGKVATQTLPGGNTDELYKNGTLEKSQSLVDQHPDVARVVWKFDRWHHFVDYNQFKKNRLIKKPGLNIPKGINNYGMKLVNE